MFLHHVITQNNNNNNNNNNTKYYNASILGGSDPSCHLCGSEIETVAHIVSGCSTLACTLYKKCHDKVGWHLHWCLCSQCGFQVVRDWWKHNPRPVDCMKNLWDFTVITDRTIHANCSDLILLLKEKTCIFGRLFMSF